MRIVAISDTHTFHRKVTLPAADILVHCGDITSEGEKSTIRDFNEWLGEQKHIKHKVVIFGNHEIGWYDQSRANKKRLMSNAHYLEDSGVEIEGVRFWGSPYQPWFHDWEFNLPKNDQVRGYPAATSRWAMIPDETQVLLTHGPPRGIMDRVERTNENVGCPILKKRIRELGKLKLHIFGHIHRELSDPKTEEQDGVRYVNACSCNESYRPIQPPVVIELSVVP